MPAKQNCTLVIPNREANNLFSEQIMELFKEKMAKVGKFKDALDEADKQTDQENYVHELVKEGLCTIYKYSVVCYKKSCRVRCRKEEFEAVE